MKIPEKYKDFVYGLIEAYNKKRVPSYIKKRGWKIIYFQRTENYIGDIFVWAIKNNLFLQLIYNYPKKYVDISVEEMDDLQMKLIEGGWGACIIGKAKVDIFYGNGEFKDKWKNGD